MTTCVEIDDPHYYLLLPRLPDERRQGKLPWIKLLAVGYSLLLSWQLTGTCLYLIRGVACFNKMSTAYMCDSNAAFAYSEMFTVVWVITLSLLIVIFLVALQNVPGFPGYKVILHQLKFLPSFWTLILFLFICLSRYVELILFHKSPVSLLILTGLALSYVLRTAAIGFLNYTQLNFLKSEYPTYIFVLSKLTLLVLFIVSLVNLLATLLSLTVEVHQMHLAMGSQNSLNFEMVNELLRDFGSTTFRFKLMSFFWQKLFIDDKNILSNHAYLS
ncbi:uncharacterized protein LOC144630470 [Oculina patagonica]